MIKELSFLTKILLGIGVLAVLLVIAGLLSHNNAEAQGAPAGVALG